MFFRARKRIKGEFRPHFFVTNDWTEFLAVAALMEVQHAKSQKTALDGRYMLSSVPGRRDARHLPDPQGPGSL